MHIYQTSYSSTFDASYNGNGRGIGPRPQLTRYRWSPAGREYNNDFLFRLILVLYHKVMALDGV